MAQVGLDFDFSSELLLNFALLELGLVEDFESAEELLGPFSGKVYSSELAFSQWFADLEHAQVEGFW